MAQGLAMRISEMESELNRHDTSLRMHAGGLEELALEHEGCVSTHQCTIESQYIIFFWLLQDLAKDEVETMRLQLDEVILETQANGDLKTRVEALENSMTDLTGNVVVMMRRHHPI